MIQPKFSTTSKISLFMSLLSKKGIIWLSLGLISSISLGFIEYSLAAFLQIFLFIIGIGDQPQTIIYLKSHGLNFGIGTAVILLITIGVFRAFFSFLSVHFCTVLRELINSNMRFLVVEKLLITRSGKGLSASEITNMFTEIFPKAGAFVFHSGRSLVVLLQATLVVLGMAYFAFYETIMCVLGALFIGFIIKILNHKLRRVAVDIPTHNKSLMETIERTTRNLLFVRISRTEYEEQKSFIVAISSYFNSLVRARFYINLSSSITPLIGITLVAVVIYISQTILDTDEKNLLPFLYLFTRFANQLSMCANDFGTASGYWVNYKFVWNYISNSSSTERDKISSSSTYLKTLSVFDIESIDHLAMIDKSNKHSRIAPEVTINNISFSWDDGRKVFENFTYRFHSGKMNMIVGQSGSGKSTLLKLITSEELPQSGEILINDITAEEYFDKYSSSIGYVGVDPFLIEGSVKENLTYGNTSRIIKDCDLWAALDKVDLSSYFKSAREGLNYRISENGDGLSAGQKQRISIARAFLKQPTLLILDEATANLDESTENTILTSISKLLSDTTVLFVTHKPHIIDNYQDALVLNRAH